MWMRTRNKGTVGTMGSNIDGPFSANLLALQLQLKTLLEESGGEAVVGLLDALCTLTGEEQQNVLRVFTSVIKRIAAGEVHLESEKDKELSKFENGLYLDLLQVLRQQQRRKPIKLEVLSGGKDEQRGKGAVVDLSKYRTTEKPVIN